MFLIAVRGSNAPICTTTMRLFDNADELTKYLIKESLSTYSQSIHSTSASVNCNKARFDKLLKWRFSIYQFEQNGGTAKKIGAKHLLILSPIFKKYYV